MAFETSLGEARRRRRALSFSAIGLTLIQLSAAFPAAAEIDPSTRAAARALGYAGVEAYDQHDYETAVERLEKAFAILQVPSVGVWTARALEKRGWLVRASERYRMVGMLRASEGDPAVQLQAQAEAARELAALLPRIPSIVITLDGPPPSQLTIDEVAVPASLVGEPIPADPGRHRIVAKRGDEAMVAEVFLRESERKSAVLRAARIAPLVANAPPLVERSSAWQKPLGLVSIGLGGALLATGAVTGLVAIGKKNSLESSGACHDDLCPSSQQGDVDDYNRLRFISTLGFVAGGALASVGTILVLVSPRSQERVSLSAGPGNISIAGRF